MTNILNNLDTLTIEGHSFKVMVIDAVVGAAFPTSAFRDWADTKGYVNRYGMWDRDALNAMEAEDLMRLYARIKGPV